jgi:hypothetical protein
MPLRPQVAQAFSMMRFPGASKLPSAFFALHLDLDAALADHIHLDERQEPPRVFVVPGQVAAADSGASAAPP